MEKDLLHFSRQRVDSMFKNICLSQLGSCLGWDRRVLNRQDRIFNAKTTLVPKIRASKCSADLRSCFGCSFTKIFCLWHLAGFAGTACLLLVASQESTIRNLRDAASASLGFLIIIMISNSLTILFFQRFER